MRRFIAALAAVVVAFIAIISVLANAQSYGIDVSVPVSQSSFSCLAGQGINFVIVRAYQSFGQADPNAPATIAAASAAGMQSVDAYVFPCRSVSASRIIQQTVASIGTSSIGTLWLDIESNPSSGCGWGGGSDDCSYLSELISAAQSAGYNVGIYSSVYEWQQTVGSSCTAGADAGLSVWYARYDGTQCANGYSDFIPFGGWSASNVAMHQYADSIGGMCGVSADANCVAGGGPNPPPPPPPPPPPSPGSSSSGSSGGCYQFWAGLCGGDDSCQCSTGAQCMTKEALKSFNRSLIKNANGGCAGQCVTTIAGECPGNSECLTTNWDPCG